VNDKTWRGDYTQPPRLAPLLPIKKAPPAAYQPPATMSALRPLGGDCYTPRMCGRYALDAPRSQLSRRFALDECVDLAARYNIAPASEVAVIRQSPGGQRVLHRLRWGLVPHWAKDPAIAARLINARGESLAEKPAFRDAFGKRRCLIPASGFYEWKKVTAAAGPARKQPYYSSLTSGEVMAFGGLWEAWTAPGGEVMRSCCIVTTAANKKLQAIHARMPLILACEHWQDWLSAPVEQAGALIRPCPEDDLQIWPVSPRVGKASEDDPALITALRGEQT
jgi:putative SOS response-associated peptidase YedK